MPTSDTRKRDLPLQKEGQYSQVYRFGGSSEPTILTGTYGVTGRQTTTSENHPNFYHEKRLSRKARKGATTVANVGRDIGGPFQTVKHEYWISHPMVHLYTTKNADRYEYHGPMAALQHLVSPTSAFWPVPTSYSDANLRAKGASAISIVSPLSPQVSIASMLGELRNDGLPLIPGLSTLKSLLGPKRLISTLGGEYLNVKFGLEPTLNDVRKLAKTVQESSKIIAQLRRDSGRPIRRHFDFPLKTSYTETELSRGNYKSSVPTLNPAFWDSMYGVITKAIYTEERIWFDGCFSYLLDPGDNAVERAITNFRIAQKLYGIAITPEVLWELTPWSWAVDWLTNIGDVIKNLSNWATSGQTLMWGYVMREERITHTYMLEGPTLKGSPSVPFIQKFTTISKRRIKASPYGFQLEWGGFTNPQLAILAALGISRSGL